MTSTPAKNPTRKIHHSRGAGVPWRSSRKFLICCPESRRTKTDSNALSLPQTFLILSYTTILPSYLSDRFNICTFALFCLNTCLRYIYNRSSSLSLICPKKKFPPRRHAGPVIPRTLSSTSFLNRQNTCGCRSQLYNINNSECPPLLGSPNMLP